MFGAGSFAASAAVSILCLLLSGNFLVLFSSVNSFSVAAAASNLTSTSIESTNLDTNNRLNTKNLNRLFKRHFSAVGAVPPTALLPVPSSPPPPPPPTTTEAAYIFNQFYPEVFGFKKNSVEYRRSDEQYPPQQQQQQVISGEGFAVPATEQNKPLYSSPSISSSKKSSPLSARPVQLYQEIKVSLGGPPPPPTTAAPAPALQATTPTTTSTSPSPTRKSEQISRTLSTPVASTSSFSSLFASSPSASTTASSAEFEANFVTRPSDQCRCVCRHGHRLESYDIELEELRAKLLQAELLSESKASSSSNRVKQKVEDVLDSLVDEDENDYDDIDELEAIQKPTKYIPMEIIELSHRRPPSKVVSSTNTSSSSSSSTSGRIPFSPSSSTTTTTSPSSSSATSSSSSNPTAITAPAYSVSFAKPVITLKAFASRVVQLGIPLLVTVALGNALTQFELTDRASASSPSSDHHHPYYQEKGEEYHRRIGDSLQSLYTGGNFTAYSPYWNSFPSLLQGGGVGGGVTGTPAWGETMQQLQSAMPAFTPGTGYYTAFYQALDNREDDGDDDGHRRASAEAQTKRRRMAVGAAKRRTASRKQTTTSSERSSSSFWRRWYEKLLN